MIWFWLTLYPIVGGTLGIPVARWIYESDRRAYPDLAKSSIREGMAEAMIVYVLMFFAWPAILLFVGGKIVLTALATRIILPAIHEYEQQKKIEQQREHVREMERELLDTHGASGIGNVPPDPAKSRRRQRTLGEEIPYGEVEDGH